MRVLAKMALTDSENQGLIKQEFNCSRQVLLHFHRMSKSLEVK